MTDCHLKEVFFTEKKQAVINALLLSNLNQNGIDAWSSEKCRRVLRSETFLPPSKIMTVNTTLDDHEIAINW